MKALPRIDVESKVPRYAQVRRILADAIAGGLFPPGSRMPDSRQIASEVDAGLVTARRAIMSLWKEGWLERDNFGHTIVRQRDACLSVAYS